MNLNEDYGHFIDIDLDHHIIIDNIHDKSWKQKHKKKYSDDNINTNTNTNTDINSDNTYHRYNKINYCIFSISFILTYYFCYIIHQNY